MQAITKAAHNNFTKSIKQFSCLSILLALMISGCAPKEVSSIYSDMPQIASDDNEHPTGFSERDLAGTKLTQKQKEIFVDFTDIEDGLSKRQLLEIAGYYEDYLSNPSRMEMFLARSESYLPYVEDVFEERNMPFELSYLAFLESGYAIKAKSHAGATGLWQFMPRTGKGYGLNQDWWGDWRHDPYKSTQSAADYLEYLHSLFDDWLLAVSAYNAGEGKIGRALDETGATSLDELVLRNDTLNSKLKIKPETLQYVPRFIALKKIMVNSDELGLKPDYSKVDRLQASISSILVNTNTDLLEVVKKSGMTWEEFHSYNPALKSYVSPSSRLIHVYVPADKEEIFTNALAAAHKDDVHEGWYVYKIRKNDTYNGLAKASGVPSSVLKQANSSKRLIAGKTILIPRIVGKSLPRRITSDYVEPPVAVAQKSNSNSSSKRVVSSNGLYKVKSGDTLYSIAREFDLSLDDIYKLNAGLTPKTLRAGSSIKLPTQAKVQEVALNTTQSYKVKSGDTLWSIARKNGTNVDTVMKLNGLSSASSIKAGQKLLLP